MYMDRDDSIWLAGLLEGEGTFGVKKDRRPGSRRPALYVHVKMTDQDVIERAARLMGTSVTIRKAEKGHWKDQYVAQANGQKAADVMNAVLPYMGIRRTTKIIECLGTPNLSHIASERTWNRIKESAHA